MPPFTVAYPSRPARRSLACNAAADLFGQAQDEPPHAVAENIEIDIARGEVALFTGPSGSGKSSLLRAVSQHYNALDAAALHLPAVPLIDAFAGPVEARMQALAACGLAEGRALLRTPAELSDGQRYRFRLAFALAQKPHYIALDEFTALLDRPLAKVVTFNLRKLAAKSGVAILAATANNDIADDLNPDVLVTCRGGGAVEVVRPGPGKKKVCSVAPDLHITPGSKADWPHFARWHYRGHDLGFVKKVFVLWHGDEPVGICVFSSPAASLTLRTHYFGLKNPRGVAGLAGLNTQLWVLSRVVLHPAYRGGGLAALFVRRACELCPVPWVETLSAMGHANPFFEKAGFVRVGVIRIGPESVKNGAFAGKRSLTDRAAAKSRYSEPVYYVFDNRAKCG